MKSLKPKHTIMTLERMERGPQSFKVKEGCHTKDKHQNGELLNSNAKGKGRKPISSKF